MEVGLAANWKVPVENALESYHIPVVHPVSFAEDPGDAESEHVLRAGWSGFKAEKFATRWQDKLLKKLERIIQFKRVPARNPGVYRHLHLYPNLLFSFTDTISLLQAVEPTSPAQSIILVRQFGFTPRAAPWWHRALLKTWNRLQAGISKTIICEDIPVHADVQAGLLHSRQKGMLGRCEERIYVFQKWLTARCGGDPRDAPDLALSSDAEAQAFMDLEGPIPAANPGKSKPDRAA
jgi:phenylpropionate dioxygenase-like ring-hydroxylating dioxygenase large terminal subunit